MGTGQCRANMRANSVTGVLTFAVIALLCAGAIGLSSVQQAFADTGNALQTKSGLVKGDVFTANGNTYKVSDVADDAYEKSEAVLVKYGSKSKKATINTVKYSGETFEVEAVGKNAFNNKAGHKVVSVKLGRNVDAIGSKAFYGCKKLKAIDMRATDLIDIEKENGRYEIDDLDIGKKAFAKAGTASIKVKCGNSNAAYRAVYKKALEKRGMRSSVKVVK